MRKLNIQTNIRKAKGKKIKEKFGIKYAISPPKFHCTC